jgi:poly-gamma-glutamate synthesis protein (capsule biosynthesis protein)
MPTSDTGIIFAVGDIGPDRDSPSESFAKVADTLRGGHAVFGQLELPLTLGGARLPQARHAIRAPIATAPALRDAGFNVISFASNHCMDFGSEAMLETLDRLRAEGIGAIGAGANIKEARRPQIVDTPGGRVAFLAYCSILPQEYWATERRAGCAPMRAFTHYEQIEHDQPGTPCRVHTFANRQDLEAVRQDIAQAKTQADVVVVSFHWGIHFVPAVLADYQQEVAYAVIDAGADLILGHHSHILKGIEVYRGKAIFYSLANFAIDLRMTEEHINATSFKEIQVLNPGWVVSTKSLFNMPPDTRKTVIVKASVRDGRLTQVGFLPVFIDDMTSVPEIVPADDPRFNEVVEYLRQIGKQAGLSPVGAIEGAEVVLTRDGAAVAAPAAVVKAEEAR